MVGNGGLLLVDKPAGWTSARVVRRVGGIFPTAKVGHAGTLDPAATGLLVVGIGEGTKVLHYLLDQSKRYRACVRLGIKTSTADGDGEVIETRDYTSPGTARLRALGEEFTGELRQVPPMYSALKHQGKRLYELARRQQTVERKPRRVTIHELSIGKIGADGFCFEVHCSKGTYIRTLVEDMGEALGTVAHLSSLRRTQSGEFSLSDAVDVQWLDQQDDPFRIVARHLLPIDAGLAHLRALHLDWAQSAEVRHGRRIALAAFNADMPPRTLLRVYDAAGALLAIALADGEYLYPRRVFHSPMQSKPV